MIEIGWGSKMLYEQRGDQNVVRAFCVTDESLQNKDAYPDWVQEAFDRGPVKVYSLYYKTRASGRRLMLKQPHSEDAVFKGDYLICTPTGIIVSRPAIHFHKHWEPIEVLV